MIKQSYEFKISGALNHYLNTIENDKKTKKLNYVYSNLSFEVFCILVERLYICSQYQVYNLYETIYGIDFVKKECLNIFNKHFLNDPKDIWDLKRLSKDQMMICYNEMFKELKRK